MKQINFNRKWRLALWVLLGVSFLFLTYRGIRKTWNYNDFDVYYMAAQLALEKSPLLYETDSPAEGRPFLYPPPAAILLAPLGLMSYKVAGVLFSLLRVAALALLLWGSLRFSAAGVENRRHWPLLLFLLLAICYRLVDNDAGNGQINIIVATIGAGGVWLMMSDSRWKWLGGGLLTLAAAAKATPLLLFAVPLLARKWRELWVATAWMALVFVLLPCAWYGPSLTKDLYDAFRESSSGKVLRAREGERQVSLSEVIVFTLAQAYAADDLVERDGDIYRIVGDEEQEARLVEPFREESAALLWLGISLAVGVVFLIARWRLFRGGGGDWTWDLAVLCALMPLLSPMVRKAHLVVLLVPVGWILCSLARRESGALLRQWGRTRAALICLTLVAVFLYVSESLSFPSLGPLPYRPAHFFALLLTLGALAFLGEPRSKKENANPPSPPLGR